MAILPQTGLMLDSSRQVIMKQPEHEGMIYWWSTQYIFVKVEKIKEVSLDYIPAKIQIIGVKVYLR